MTMMQAPYVPSARYREVRDKLAAERIAQERLDMMREIEPDNAPWFQREYAERYGSW